MLEPTKKISVLVTATFLAACGEPAFENAGSKASLLEDREACAAEIDNSPSANVYRQNPDAHPEYPMQVFGEMNRCIERKGWKQVRSVQEQEELRDAIASEVKRGTEPVAVSGSNATERLRRAIERRLTAESGVERSQPHP
jgi:hypothetical protein